jgi:hypothetical protein
LAAISSAVRLWCGGAAGGDQCKWEKGDDGQKSHSGIEVQTHEVSLERMKDGSRRGVVGGAIAPAVFYETMRAKLQGVVLDPFDKGSLQEQDRPCPR